MKWIIGDIHGCHAELVKLLERIPSGDPLIFLGDYIDRGPDSYRVVERLLREKDRSVYLMGNHEYMMFCYFQDPHSSEGLAWTYWANGGQSTLKSYGQEPDKPAERIPPLHREFFNSLKLFHEEDDFIAVHAGVRINGSTSMEDQEQQDLLWIRGDWLNQEHLWDGKKIYYGHTPSRYIFGTREQHRPIQGEKSMGIDTGCVYGGFLTAVNSVSGELIQVRASQEYLQV